MKALIPALCALALAGCSAGGGAIARYDGGRLNNDDREPRAIPAKDLLVSIPEWAGPPKNARQQNTGDVTRQSVVIAGGTRGDNIVDVQLESRDGVNHANYRLRAPLEADITEELRSRFPGVEMRPAGRSQGGGGDAIDIAIGRAADGTRCLYGWRWDDDLRAAFDPSGIATVKSMVSQQSLAGSMRIRLCSKYVTLDDLASLARQIRYNKTANLDHIITGAPVPGDEPAPSPVKDTTLENAFACPGAPDSCSLEGQSHPVAQSRRKLASRPTVQVQPAELSAPLDTSAAAGPRYLATPPTAQSSTAPMSSSPASGGAPVIDLPAAALRGPSASGGGQAAASPNGY
jgi:Cellulose biosynthesis protein BcsN